MGASTRLGGYHIGEICCAFPTYAHDSAPMSEGLSSLQSHISMAKDYKNGIPDTAY